MTNRERAIAWYESDEGDVNGLTALLDAAHARGVRAALKSARLYCYEAGEVSAVTLVSALLGALPKEERDA